MNSRVPVFMALIGGIGLFFGSAQAQSLEEALTAAYLSNPTLAAQRASLRATDEGVSQALSNWRPNVTLSTDYGWSAYKTDQATGTARSQHRNPNSYALTVDQPIFRGMRTVAQRDRAENQVMAARARLAETEQSILLDAVSAYMNVVRDQAVLELNINNEQVLRRQLEAARDRFEVGEITRTDVHQAESRWVGATADRIQAEGNLEASRATFRNVVGEAPGRLTAPTPSVEMPTDAEEAIKISVTANPSVIAAEYDEKSSQENVKLVRGELLPTVSLSGTLSKAFDQSGQDTMAQNAQAKVTLSVPLYQKGAVYSRLRGAKQTAAQSRLLIDQARRSATETATRAWEGLKTAEAQIEALQSQVNAAEIALDGVQREAEVGSRTVLDVLDAEQELLDAKVNLVRAQRDYTVAVYELRSAMGQLTARHLALPVEYYDPESHYMEVRDQWFGGNSSGQ